MANPRNWLIPVALVLVMLRPAVGQEMASTPADTVTGAPADTMAGTPADTMTAIPADSTAMVVFEEVELFEVVTGSAFSAQDRADRYAEGIMEAAKSQRIRLDELWLKRDDRIGATLLMADRQYLGIVFDFEAAALGYATEELAQHRLDVIREAIDRYRSDYSVRSLIKAGIIAAVTIILYVVILKVMTWLRNRFESKLEERVGGRKLFKVLEGESLVRVVSTANRLVYFLTVLWLTLFGLNFVLSLFPWTHGVATQIFEMAAGPLRATGQAIVEEIPSLFFLAFIIFAATFVLRGIRFVFDEIGRGRIRMRGFHDDWARPTFNLVRIFIIGFAVVVAFPYIPGSDSAAFKGVSLFVGLIVSLGSGSAVANVISGVILIYMRPYAIGDRVQIGDSMGDVVDRNLLTTRIRTPKNERVVIPNSNILSGQIINYTSKARTRELILHTSITIGYDVAWRQVHELLLAAAAATENVMEDPEPFVLQKALNDFYVEYELNAHTDQPRLMTGTYSELHQNIQDQFDAAGVEILSPHYRQLRQDDAGATTVKAVPPEEKQDEQS